MSAAPTTREGEHASHLVAKRLKLLSQDDAIVLMRTDCHVCKSEGLSARARVLLTAGDRRVIATLYQVENDWLTVDEAGLSEAAWKRLAVADGRLRGESMRAAPDPAGLTQAEMNALAAASTVLCVLLGVPMAMVLARSPSRAVLVVRPVLLLPLVLPPVVGGIALLYAFGRLGLLGRYLEAAGIQIAFTTAAVVLAQKLLPDVVVMDISMPEMNGLKATQNLKRTCPDINVLTLTRHTDDGYLQQLLQSGSSGYILKQSASEELVRAIRLIADHDYQLIVRGDQEGYLDLGAAPVVAERVVAAIGAISRPSTDRVATAGRGTATTGAASIQRE